jgi:ABC-type nitrate/sulfonate/bicarbonate transport system ATPase subunit
MASSIKTPAEIELMRESSRIVGDVIKLIGTQIDRVFQQPSLMRWQRITSGVVMQYAGVQRLRF